MPPGGVLNFQTQYSMYAVKNFKLSDHAFMYRDGKGGTEMRLGESWGEKI